MKKNIFSELIIASSNKGKINEFQNYLKSLELVIHTQPDGIVVNENGNTFKDNAMIKAKTVSEFTDKLILGDDSGLCVDSLNGGPGIFSARYAKDDKSRIEKLLFEMKSFQNRKATFVAALCIAHKGEILIQVEGICKGNITYAPRGISGFGYDPVFEVEGTNLTYAEMSINQKRYFGHRGEAIKLLLPELKKLISN